MSRAACIVLFLLSQAAMAVDCPVAFLAYPRTATDGWFLTQSVSERVGPYVHHPGTDLMLMQPDGTETVLVKGLDAATGMIAVHDFCVDLDGKSIVYSHIRSHAGIYGTWCDLYRIVLDTGEVTQLTDALTEWNPPWGAAQFATEHPATATQWSQWRSRGTHHQTVWNIGPCFAGDGSIMFCSNRQAAWPPVDSNGPSFQIFRMAADGKYVRLIGHMNIAGGLHPSLRTDGKILFSSMEQQGARTQNGNGWAIWSMNPDGSDWGPEISSIGDQTPFHFQTETTNRSLVAAQYYDTKVYGTLRVAPLWISDPFGPPTKFGHPLKMNNPPVFNGGSNAYYSFMPRGFYTPLPWSSTTDRIIVNADGETPGSVSHPQAIPGNGIFLTWTNDTGRDADLGVYMMPDITVPMPHHSQLVAVVDRDDRHEWMGRPVVPFSAIYGLTTPPVPVGLEAMDLPPGSPFGVVSTSSMAWPEIVQPPFGSNQKFDNFTLDQAQYIRILGFNKTTSHRTLAFARSLGGGDINLEGFNSPFVNERIVSYGEVPLWKYRKTDGGIHYGPDPPEGATVITDPEGKPDTSFRVQIPADQPWTFQTLNAKKEAVSTAQTWHQINPGEFRTCGGCHTHHGRVPFAWEESFAAGAEYVTPRLQEVRLAAWERDVKPIVEKYSLPLTEFPAAQGIKFYNSDDTDVDDDPRLTRDEAETIRLWIDTGMIGEGTHVDVRKTTPGRKIVEADKLGPFADTQGPTISHAVFANRIVIGLFDPQAGIDVASFSVKCSIPLGGTPAGTELAAQFSHDEAEHIWTLTTAVPEGGDLSISVRDQQVGINLYGEPVGEGNRTSVTIPLIHEAEREDVPDVPVDPKDEEIEELRHQIELLEAELAALRTRLEILLETP